MLYFTELLLNGAIAGSLYALVALALVVVYKASRVVNFALGELIMIATSCVGVGLHVLGFGLAGAIAVGCVGAAGVGVAFNYLVLRHIGGERIMSLIMVTIGFGAFARGAAAFLFSGVPSRIELPVEETTVVWLGLLLSPHELLVGGIALMFIAGLSLYFAKSRAGIALRAISDDQQVATGVGINLNWHFALTWAIAGLIAVVGGVLWTFLTGGGFSMVLIGLKVLPIVIIGGLESIPGVLVGAMLIGVLESLAAGYLDAHVGGGASGVTAFVVLVAVLLARPYGLFGRARVERV